MPLLQKCPNVLEFGTCQDTNCSYYHNIRICEPCGIVVSSPHTYNAHLNGKRHKKNISKTSNPLVYCQLCCCTLPQNGWEDHVSGARHAGRANVTAGSWDEPEDIPGYQYCDLCRRSVPQRRWDQHTVGMQHQRAVRFAALRVALEETEREKQGIVIEGTAEFGVVDPDDAEEGCELVLHLKATAPGCKISLIHVRLSSSTDQVSRSAGDGAFTVAINGRQTMTMGSLIKIRIILRTAFIGHYSDRIEFTFRDLQLSSQFAIARPIKAIVGNKDEFQRLQPTTPYAPRARTARPQAKEIVEGPAPPETQTINYVAPLPKATIPQTLLSLLSSSHHLRTSGVMERLRRVHLPRSFDTTTYSQYYLTLLWIEECKSEQDLERYDIKNTTLGRHRETYHLEVLGLAEKRPSVLVGDSILVQRSGDLSGRWFEGRVFRVEREVVKLRFHGSFTYSSTARYDVRFRLNRIPYRRQHQAMNTAFAEARILFPLAEHLNPPHNRTRFRPFNSLIDRNPRQYEAVSRIKDLPPGSVPFVIFGPPGTGKTMTTIEAILQVVRNNPNARVLACAPSNSAADILTHGLLALDKHELFRFYAPSRSNTKDDIDHRIRDRTYINANGHFALPPLASVKRYRVVVTTCVSASVLFGVGVPCGHYSHIFIDEAGQATEPEAFISIKTMADTKTNVILSGDPKQLGPIIRSGIARAIGLETSYLERMMSRELYESQRGNGATLVKLTKNYRSHSDILKFPNERFYQGELEPCGDKATIEYYLGSSYLPTKSFPIVFHAVHGQDDREASSPSFFNATEVLQVKRYVQKLREDRRFRTSEKDIGIIAPYHAQCLKIRNSLRGVADDIKVGSVEEFQGQERRVIIISTVRSSREFIEYDLKHTLGFVANPRRFNVAVTRAQALLIIVGDPQVLSIDPLWRSFLNYIHNNGGWTGPRITWDPTEPVDEAEHYDQRVRNAAELNMNEFTRRMEALTLAEVSNEEDEEDANVDRPWREVE